MEFINPTKNVRVAFKDIGAFGEYLAINFYPGFVGGGSGGMGLDLVNKSIKKSIEVKTCCTLQNSKCKKCSTKFNSLFSSFCPNCNSKDYKEINDSRFGINSKELLTQYDKNLIHNLTLAHISLYTFDKVNKELSIYFKWYNIDFSDLDILNIQLDYFKNQKTKGRATTSNLLPDSYDFYKLCPKLFQETIISIPYSDIHLEPKIIVSQLNVYPRISESILSSSELLSFRKLKTYDLSTKTANSKDFTLNMPYRNKSLGKLRGDTRRNVYKQVSS
jgi:hypothetical protein